MTSVQVRDVPEPVVDALKQDASEHGQSLQQYLQDLLAEQARVATTSAIMAGAAADARNEGSAGFDAAELVRESRDQRGDELLARAER